MTVVAVLSDCPPRLRGDMTKWFVEVNTGVYVGNMSARVRDELWDRIVDNLSHGHATMMFTAAGEQHMDFRVHNAYWEIVDFDGVKLMRRPDPTARTSAEPELKVGFSKASRHRKSAMRKPADKWAGFCASVYVVLDLETTGLDESSADIIEIGALLVENGKVLESFQTNIQIETPVPEEIQRLTGITDEMLLTQGVPLKQGLSDFLDFAEDFPLVCHNAPFEQAFMETAMKKTGITEMDNRYIDTLSSARELFPGLESYKLADLSERLSVPVKSPHRSLADCEMTMGVYEKLKEAVSSQIRK